MFYTPSGFENLNLEQLHKLIDDFNFATLISQDNDYEVPEVYKEKLLEQIIGFNMPISEIQGKFKLGQNRSQIDQQSFIEALQHQKNSNAKQLAAFIRSLNTSE